VTLFPVYPVSHDTTHCDWYIGSHDGDCKTIAPFDTGMSSVLQLRGIQFGSPPLQFPVLLQVPSLIFPCNVYPGSHEKLQLSPSDAMLTNPLPQSICPLNGAEHIAVVMYICT